MPMNPLQDFPVQRNQTVELAMDNLASLAAARSDAFNKKRQDNLKTRQKVQTVGPDAEQAIRHAMIKQADRTVFVTNQILRGALLLSEDNITVQCRECDVFLVEACLKPAAEEYASLMEAETGAAKKCKFTTDTSNYLSPSCLGGVVVLRQDGTGKIDKTIDMQLKLVLAQETTAIPNLLSSYLPCAGPGPRPGHSLGPSPGRCVDCKFWSCSAARATVGSRFYSGTVLS